MINLLRLTFLFLVFLILYPFLKDKAIYHFLKLSGPSFIKLGQALSARPDLVGQNLAQALSSFQDKLDPFSSHKVKQILQEQYGDVTTIFREFDYQAVASASIAQVHKAVTLQGDVVAVKILRPNIAKIMARDIRTLRFIIRIISIFSKFLAKSLLDIHQLLRDLQKSELDLMREAANASRLKEELRDVKGFYVPQVYWHLTSSKILVLEWIDAIAFSNKEAILKSDLDKKQIARNLVISYFTQVYGNGFFHADMHQGNLFLLQNGDIAVVDFGIMGKIAKKTRIAVAEILIGFLNRDYQQVAQIHIDAGFVPRDTDVDDLALSCRKIGESIVDSSIKDIPLSRLLTNLVTMTRDYQMTTKPELLLLQKTLLLVEGVGVMLDPDLNMWEIARPWVKQWAKTNIGFDAKIRDALIDLMNLGQKFLRQL